MNCLFRLLFVFAFTSALCVSVHAESGQVANDTVKAFLVHVQDLDTITAEQKESVVKTVAEFAESATDAITESLIIMYPSYADAVEASDGENLSETVNVLQPFADSDDRFLAADASFYLARCLMNNEQFERALPLLKNLTGDLEDRTVHAGNAQFFTGVAQAGLLDTKAAIESFMEFLQFNPDAPERLRVAAWRQVQELRLIKKGELEDIYQRMDFSRRRLRLEEPDDVTQTEQKTIVDMLAKLIKEQEKKECSSKGSSKSASKKQQQQQKKQQSAAKDPKQNKSQQGGQSNNPNGTVVDKSYDDGPSSPWSRLRDRSRDPANNAIKDKLPARYRDIVERYYEAANGNDKK